MKKLTSFALVAMLAVCGLSLTGCGGGGEGQVVDMEGTAPPPALNQVQMEQYSKEMSSKGQGK